MVFPSHRGRAELSVSSLTPSSSLPAGSCQDILHPPPPPWGTTGWEHRALLCSSQDTAPPASPSTRQLSANGHLMPLKPQQRLSTQQILPRSAPRTTSNATGRPSLQLLQAKEKCAYPDPQQLGWHLQLLASHGSSICSRTGLLGSWIHSKSVIPSPAGLVPLQGTSKHQQVAL